MIGPGLPDPPALGATLVSVTPAVPIIAAQPFGGRRWAVGVALADGSILLPYGDETANSGPIDVVGWNPDTGVVITYLAATPTERINRYRELDGGDVWAVSADPQGSDEGFLITNAGGTWHTLPCGVAGLPVAVHMYDIAQTSALYVCGVRDLTVAERGGESPSVPASVAFVWRSTDAGSTWTEELSEVSLTSSAHYFHDLLDDEAGGLIVESSDGSGYYRRSAGAWGAKVPAPAPVLIDGNARTLATDGGRTLYIDDNYVLTDTDLGQLCLATGPHGTWTGTYHPNGIYVADEVAIYRVDLT